MSFRLSTRRKPTHARPKTPLFRRLPLIVAVPLAALLCLVGSVAPQSNPGAIALGSPARAAEALTSPFTVTNAVIRPATRTPKPASGSEVLLYSNASTATITLRGSGKVVLALGGSSCHGMPIVAVDVDGKRTGQVLVKDQATYFYAYVGTPVGSGTHRVTVRMINDLTDGPGCDRNAVVSAARMQFPAGSSPTGSTPSGYGVPTGTALKVHSGDLVITKAGTVIDGLDVRGRIEVKPDNVTIKRSVVRGGAVDSSHYRALVASWWGYKNLQIYDTTLRAQYTSLRMDGLSGANYTAQRLDVSNVVDAVKVIGSNVTLLNSWLHDNVHSSNDPYAPDRVTHDDSVQIVGGTNVLLRGNKMEKAHNAAVMVTQDYSATSNVRIENNSLSNGACTVNVTMAPRTTKIYGMSITGNRFGAGTYGTVCPMRLPKASSFTISGNSWILYPLLAVLVQWF